jgi:hypothetical protein
VEVIEPRGFGRVRMAPVADGSAASLHAFVTDHVAPGARVITDGWAGYRGLDKLGYTHEPRSQRAARARGEDPGELLPAVHRVASLAKRWLLGTHHGAIDDAHLPDYLDVRVPLQPPPLSQSRPAVLPGPPTRRRPRPGALPRPDRPTATRTDSPKAPQSPRSSADPWNAHPPADPGETPTCSTPVKWIGQRAITEDLASMSHGAHRRVPVEVADYADLLDPKSFHCKQICVQVGIIPTSE